MNEEIMTPPGNACLSAFLQLSTDCKAITLYGFCTTQIESMRPGDQGVIERLFDLPVLRILGIYTYHLH